MNMKLFTALRNRGLKQRDLAHRIRSAGGYPRDEAVISKIVNERMKPGPKHKYWICRVLGVEEERIF